mmetsp:Transcript_49400/g.105003  ORF Transcript_49400/g.105003 Transcript_49400/m.105003 type:complete len:414 (-) Transcript_49400:137-1378(-)
MKLAISALLLCTATATSSSIGANSKMGKNLLSKARRLDGGNDDMSWAGSYSLRFEKCATSADYYGGYFGGNQDGDEDNRYYYNGMYQQRLVHFKLCPTESCGSGCTGGEYVIDMNQFVQAYMEYKVEAEEAECESVAENCYCENANDDEACEMQCYISAGIYDQCVEQDNQNNNGQQEDEFELEEALECSQLEVDEDAANYYAYQNGDNNGNYNQNNQNNQQEEMEFFVGPYCSEDGQSIVLGVFMDEVCGYPAPEGIYEQFHYGKALPYSTESIISNDCISCMQPGDDDNNNNNQNNDNGNNNYNYNQNQEDVEIREVCEQLYEDAGKCESNLDVYGVYPNTMACDFISGLKASGKTRIFSKLANTTKNVTSSVLAGVFAATTLVLVGVSYHYHQKLQRQSVNLVQGEGNMA